jgi:hypothetical protein
MAKTLDFLSWNGLSDTDRRILQALTTPQQVQAFLDEIEYSADSFYRSPIQVLRERKGHCFDGALFAAAVMRRLGYPPLILEMLPNERDDDHLLALFRVGRNWGAVAKSNFVGLRFREPVYRSLRELVMSYFEHYYNVNREKTLRGYTVPLRLDRFDHLNWLSDSGSLDAVADGLDRLRRFSLLDPDSTACLNLVDERSYRTGLSGSNPEGLFKPVDPNDVSG